MKQIVRLEPTPELIGPHRKFVKLTQHPVRFGMATPTLRQWIEEGPFTLALSSSFFGFFSHCGVSSAFFEKDFLPSKITGSSAGALVGGALASGLDPDATKNLLFQVKREDFWDPRPGLGYLKGNKFLNVVERSFCPNFKDTKIRFEAAALDLFSFRTRFLKQGSLPKAVVASCAVPLLFHPVRIGSRLYVDGGIFHKSGINPEDKSERLLCVFLQGDGISDSYELGRSLKGLSPNHRVLRLKDLPRLNYNSLERGKIAHTEAYRRTAQAFDKKFIGKILDA